MMFMKKQSFMQGAFIATIAIVISKILGVLYVIPFYAIIGEQGGALYGYAYNVYIIFLGIASVGLPLAMSKLVSEYNVLGYYYSKERSFKIGKTIISAMGVLSFLLLIIFAPKIAYLILGDIQGGNTIEDVSFVIRAISLSILVVPVQSLSRGYLQGHRFISPTAMSQIIEQLVRVIFIIVGSFLALRVFNLGLTYAVGVAVFGAFVGAFCSYLYLLIKIKTNKASLNRTASKTRTEKNITDKVIIQNLLFYSVSFIIIDVSKNIYNSVDMVTLIKTLVNGLNYSVNVAETVMATISTWGHKLNMIVASISMGLIVSLIPNLASSFAANDISNVRNKINQALQLLLYTTLPMAVGLSLLAKPVWMAFYGESFWGPVVFSYSVFTVLFATLFTIVITMLQSLNRYKMVFGCLMLGLIIKITLNIPLIYSFEQIGFHGFYGATTATILGYLISSIIGLILLGKEFSINYENTLKQLINIVLATMIMTMVIALFKLVIPIDVESRLLSLGIILIYSIIGASTYLFITYRNKTFHHIFGQKTLDLIFAKLRIKK